jgi:tetratricopeptide (TPR) repeat protein
VLDRAASNADRAIALAPENGEAYAARALVEYQQGRLDKMRASLKEAFARTAHSPLAYYGAGYYYLSCGLADRSVPAFLRARELEPTLVRLEPGLAYRFQGEFQKSAQQLQKDLDSYPDDQIMTIALLVTRVFMGDVEGARQLEPKVLARSPDDPSVQAGLALLRAREGKPFPIDEWARKYEKVYWADGGYSGHVAAAYAMAGRKQEALRWLRRSGQLSFRNYVYLSKNPAYDNLRDTAEFKTYLATLRREWEEAKRKEEQAPLIPPAENRQDR